MSRCTSSSRPASPHGSTPTSASRAAPACVPSHGAAATSSATPSHRIPPHARTPARGAPRVPHVRRRAFPRQDSVAALVDWASLLFFFGSCVSYLVIIGVAARSKGHGSQPPMRPPTAPEAGLLAQGHLLRPRGAPLRPGCQIEGAAALLCPPKVAHSPPPVAVQARPSTWSRLYLLWPYLLWPYLLGDAFNLVTARGGDDGWYRAAEGEHYARLALLLLLGFTACCLLPLSLLRSMDSLQPTSAVAMVR